MLGRGGKSGVTSISSDFVWRDSGNNETVQLCRLRHRRNKLEWNDRHDRQKTAIEFGAGRLDFLSSKRRAGPTVKSIQRKLSGRVSKRRTSFYVYALEALFVINEGDLNRALSLLVLNSAAG